MFYKNSSIKKLLTMPLIFKTWVRALEHVLKYAVMYTYIWI